MAMVSTFFIALTNQSDISFIRTYRYVIIIDNGSPPFMHSEHKFQKVA
jgi:hypothetical protein